MIVAVGGGGVRDHARVAVIGVRPIALHGDLHQAGGERGGADRRRVRAAAAQRIVVEAAPELERDRQRQRGDEQRVAGGVGGGRELRDREAVEAVELARLVGARDRGRGERGGEDRGDDDGAHDQPFTLISWASWMKDSMIVDIWMEASRCSAASFAASPVSITLSWIRRRSMSIDS